MQRYKVEEVFKLSGVPDVTFVEPIEYDRLLVALRTPGRGVVIEGPSGIGKTSAVTRALDQLSAEGADSILKLSARKPDDRDLIHELPTLGSVGFVIIDDFHRLDTEVRKSMADFLKVLADEERQDTKVVVVGINQAGRTLLSFAPDLGGRIEVIKFEVNPDDRVQKVVDLGCEAMNAGLSIGPEIVAAAGGSFNIAQMLCHDAFLTAGVVETGDEYVELNVSFELVRERVLDRLADSFYKRAEMFAKGKKLRREGRAPYLQILRWLAESEEWTVDLDREMSKRPELKGSVSQVVDKGHLANHLQEHEEELGSLLHFNEESHVLGVEDPKFFFFIKNLPWNRFAERIGYLDVQFSARYDFALSFAGSDRDVAGLIFEELSSREYSVFYDKDEEARILAANVEEYLAPIYKSEATFVVAVMGPEYPERIWTKFESEQFKQRFGDGAVIPVWFEGMTHAIFDEARKYGGFTIDRSKDLESQVKDLCDTLSEKLRDYRITARSEAASST